MFHQNRQIKVKPGVFDKMGGPMAHPGHGKSSVVDPEQKLGPCAKKRVKATLVCLSGSRFIGTNDCFAPQKVCPRTPSEGYAKCASVCRQPGHAELMAIRAAGDAARGGTMYIEGIGHVCDDCQRAMRELDIKWQLGMPSGWIDIAWRPRHGAQILRWRPELTSPYSVEEARELYNSSLWDMATRNEPDRAVLCIKKRSKPDPFRRRIL